MLLGLRKVCVKRGYYTSLSLRPNTGFGFGAFVCASILFFLSSLLAVCLFEAVFDDRDGGDS